MVSIRMLNQSKVLFSIAAAAQNGVQLIMSTYLVGKKGKSSPGAAMPQEAD